MLVTTLPSLMAIGIVYCLSVDISFFRLSLDHVMKRSRDFEGWVFVVISTPEVQIQGFIFVT